MSSVGATSVLFSIPERAVEILRALSEAHGLRLSWSPAGGHDKPSLLKLTPRGVEGEVRWRCMCSSVKSDLPHRTYVGSLRGSTMAAMRDYVAALWGASREVSAAARRARIQGRRERLEKEAGAIAAVATAFAEAMPGLRAEWPAAPAGARQGEVSDVE